MSLVEELMADLEDDEEDLEIPEIKQEDDMETEDVKPTKLELEQIPTGKVIYKLAIKIFALFKTHSNSNQVSMNKNFYC